MEAEVLPGIDVWTALAGVVVCFLAAALGGLSGMGSGLIVTLFVTPIIGPKAVIPVMSIFMLINNGSRVWFYREALVWRHAVLIAAVAVPASALGALLYVRLDGEAIRVLLGAILILSVPLRRWMAGRKVEPGGGSVVAVAGAFGFLSSIIVGAGILILPVLMGLGLLGPALIATDAAIAVMVNLAKILFFSGLDALTLEMAVLAVAMGLCAVPGTWAGVWIVRHTPLRVHTLLIEALILVGGVSMIVGGL